MVSIIGHNYEEVMLLKSGKPVKPSDRKLAMMVQQGKWIPENRLYSSHLAYKTYTIKDYTNSIHFRTVNLEKDLHPILQLIRNIYQKVKNFLMIQGRFVTDLQLLKEAQDKLNGLNIEPPLKQDVNPEENVEPPLKQDVNPEENVEPPLKQDVNPEEIVEPPLKQDVNPGKLEAEPIPPYKARRLFAWAKKIRIEEGFNLNQIMMDPKKKQDLAFFAEKWKECRDLIQDEKVSIQRIEELLQLAEGQLKPLFQRIAPFEDPIGKYKVDNFFRFIINFNPQGQQLGFMYGLKRPQTSNMINLRTEWSIADLSELIALDVEYVKELLNSTKSQANGTYTAQSIIAAIKALSNREANELEDQRWPNGSLRWCLN